MQQLENTLSFVFTFLFFAYLASIFIGAIHGLFGKRVYDEIVYHRSFMLSNYLAHMIIICVSLLAIIELWSQ